MDCLRTTNKTVAGIRCAGAAVGLPVLQSASEAHDAFGAHPRHVRYQHVAESPGRYSIGVFVLPPGTSLPLHDHPGMTVLSQLYVVTGGRCCIVVRSHPQTRLLSLLRLDSLYGSVAVTSYDWVDKGRWGTNFIAAFLPLHSTALTSDK